MADKKKADQKNIQILSDLLNKPENRQCCECGEKGPRWASWNLGCFFCLTCAGIHRRLGTHISRVKSVTLDSWTQEQIDSIVSKGNSYVNAIYDPFPERHRPCPKGDDAALEQWIRDKYERKLFADPGKRFESGGQSQGQGSGQDDRKKYALELMKLRDMGFDNEEANLHALRQTNGNLNNAVNIVVKLPPTSQSAPHRGGGHDAQAANLASLVNFGFKDERKNIEALRQANGNLDQAVNILVKQAVSNAQSSPPPAHLSAPARSAAPAAAPARGAQAQQPVIDLMGDFGAPAPATANGSSGFGDFSSFGSTPAAAPVAAKGPTDAFGGVDLFAPAPVEKKPANKNDILSLYSTGSSQPTPGFGGQPGFGGPQQGFGGAPQQGGFGGPQGGFGGPQGGFGGPQGGFGGAPQQGGFGGAPQGGFGGQQGGFGGQPQGGFGGQQAFGGQQGFGGQPQGGFGGQQGGFGGQPQGGFGGQQHGGFGGQPQGGFGGQPQGGFGGQPQGGFGGQQHGGFGGQQGGFGGQPQGGFGGQPGYGAPQQGGFGGAPHQGGSNPFGSPSGQPASSNPFGAPSAAAQQPNPFGQFGNVNQTSNQKNQFNWN